MDKRPIIVRFAPSPTGYLHLGNVRAAIYNDWFAQSRGGAYFLRIDDTDLERSHENHVDAIVKDLKWLGLDIGSNQKRQSKRLDVYKKYAEQLLTAGKAYPCFCSEEQLKADRQTFAKKGEPPRYIGRCRDLSEDKRKSFENEKIKPVIRINTATCGKPAVVFDDIIRGEVEIPLSAFGDFVIMRSSGMPSYNFASSIDDMDMQVSHILRGVDHLSNSARQMLVWHMLGHNQVPEFAHLALIVGNDGAPLSKREGNTSVAGLRSKGYLAKAIYHYLAQLGNSAVSDDVAKFCSSNSGFNWPAKSSTVAFSLQKLRYFNKQYLQFLTTVDIQNALRAADIELPYGYERQIKIIEVFKTEFESLLDFKDLPILWSDDWNSLKSRCSEFLNGAQVVELMNLLARELKSDLDSDGQWQELVKSVGNQVSFPKKTYFKGLRLILSGQDHGPELYKIVKLLGRDYLSDLTNQLRK